jgi:hypothetical protein
LSGSSRDVHDYQDFVVGANRFVNAQMRIKSDIGNHQGTARPSRDRADRS